MAVGKTTLGRGLAVHLGLPFVDLDEEVALAAGASVRDIFRAEGEAGFRARERAALEAALRAPAFVLALGGGAAHQPGAATLLAGVEVFVLQRPWAALAAWLGADPARPLAAEAHRLYAARAPAEPALGRCVPLPGPDPQADLAVLIAAVETAA